MFIISCPSDMRLRIMSSTLGNRHEDPEKRNMCPKFAVIIPESCFGPPVVDKICGNVKVEGYLPFYADHGGIQAMDFKSTVYSIRDERNKKVCVWYMDLYFKAYEGNRIQNSYAKNSI